MDVASFLCRVKATVKLFARYASLIPWKTSGSSGCSFRNRGNADFILYTMRWTQSFQLILFHFVIFLHSEAFGDGINKKLVEGRSIKAFLLFKKGIQPEWEDPANKNGSELTAQKTVHVEVMDFYWENLVLGLIGETIDEGDQICGCRIVNQTRKTKPTYKLELWLKTAEEETCNKFRNRLVDVLTDGDNSQGSKLKALDFELIRRK